MKTYEVFKNFVSLTTGKTLYAFKFNIPRPTPTYRI